ncbi:flagellar hook-associated protein 3 [Nitrospira sp.]|nr:flagellar hook-associated protein 3 [Nitrospira sp.]
MRVADSQILGLLTGNLARTRSSILSAQQQVATQKRVSQPSDDPVVYGQVLQERSELSRTDQWTRNIQFGTQRLQLADSTLTQTSSVLARIKELAVQARSDTVNPENRQAIAQEVRQLQQHLVQLANSEVNGQAIFGGTKTDTPPYVLGGGDNITYVGNAETQSIAVGEGLTIQVLIPGSQVFSGPTVNIFDGIRDLLVALESNSGAGIEAGIGSLDQSLTQVTNVQGQVGGLVNRLETTQDWLDQANTLLTQTISENEDADLAQAITELSKQQVALQATQATLSRVFETSLLNFLQ